MKSKIAQYLERTIFDINADVHCMKKGKKLQAASKLMPFPNLMLFEFLL